MASLRAPSIAAVPDSPARKNEHPPPSVPIGQWQDWQGLLLPDSDTESEAALHLWLRFEISNGTVQLVNDYHIMQSYSIHGTYDADKCSLHFTQTFLDSEKHSHKSREFSGTITVGPHDDDPNYVTWKMEGTYVATKGRNRRSTLNHGAHQNLNGSFYLEVSDLPPTQEFHRKRRTALVTMPVDRELMWEQDENRQPLPSSSSSASHHHHHPTFYPISLKFNEGHQITAARDPSVLIEGSYNNHDPPTFHFTQRSISPTGGSAVRTYQGRIEYDGNTKLAVAANAASGDTSHLRLKGYQTRVDKEAKVFEFIGPFVLKIAAYQPQFSSSLMLSPPNAHRVLSSIPSSTAAATNNSETPTNARSAGATPPFSARRIAEELDKEIANAANEEAKAKEKEEQAARDKIKEGELAAALKAALELEEAEKQRKAKADAEAEEAAQAAAEEAARVKAEAALVARREAEAKARAEAEEAEKAQAAQRNCTSTPASPTLSSRDQEALFKQQQAERAAAAAQAEAEAIAEEKRILAEKLQLAEQRKKALEEAKAKRKKEIDAERARMEALAESSRRQREEERKARLAQIEASKAEIRQAMREQDEQEAAAASADAGRRAVERSHRERTEASRMERLRKKQERSLRRQSQGMSPEEIDALETEEDIAEAQAEAAEVDSELEDGGMNDPHSDAIAQNLKPQAQPQQSYPYQPVVHPPQQRARDRTKQKLAAAAAAAAEEKSNEYIPFHARPPPDKGAFQYGKMQTKGILTQIFDLVAVEENANNNNNNNSSSSTSSASNTLSPPLCSAILPLTLVYSPAGLPLRYYTTDSSGHIRCAEWEVSRARSLFERFERNVQLQRAAQIAAKQHPNVEGMEELAAQLLVADGSLPMVALTLLEVGSILKNGFKSLSQLSSYGGTKEGFIIQSFVFQPHATVYRAEFASGGAAGVGAYFNLERRTNKHSLYAPNKPPNPFNPPTLTLSNRIASYKSGAFTDRDSVREVLSAKVAERIGESQYNREMYSQMRRLCVGIIKRINDKTQSEDAVLVQRLCLYFKADLEGPIHFLFGDRFDFRIDESKAAAKQQQQQQQMDKSTSSSSSSSSSSTPAGARKRYLQSSAGTTSSAQQDSEENEDELAADEQKIFPSSKWYSSEGKNYVL